MSTAIAGKQSAPVAAYLEARRVLEERIAQATEIKNVLDGKVVGRMKEAIGAAQARVADIQTQLEDLAATALMGQVTGEENKQRRAQLEEELNKAQGVLTDARRGADQEKQARAGLKRRLATLAEEIKALASAERAALADVLQERAEREGVAYVKAAAQLKDAYVKLNALASLIDKLRRESSCGRAIRFSGAPAELEIPAFQLEAFQTVPRQPRDLRIFNPTFFGADWVSEAVAACRAELRDLGVEVDGADVSDFPVTE